MDKYTKGGRNGGGNRGGGFQSGGRRDFDSGRGSGPRNMHKAICSNCNKSCEVPFRPTGDKPVYCSDCFANSSGSSSSKPQRNDRRDSRLSFGGGNERPQSGGGNEEIKRQLEKINDKLERLITAVHSQAEVKKVKKNITPKKEIVKKVVEKKEVKKAIKKAIKKTPK